MAVKKKVSGDLMAAQSGITQKLITVFLSKHVNKKKTVCIFWVGRGLIQLTYFM